MKPVAFFTHSASGLAVTFTDHSQYGPTSWSWDFGDGSIVDTTQNPSHTYSVDGFYVVTLTVANNDGTCITPYRVPIGVRASGVSLPLSISNTVDLYLPTNLILNTNQKPLLITKWLLFLHPLVIPVVEEEDILNEFAYPPLVAQLVAELVAFDLIVQNANAYLLSIANSTGSENKGPLIKVVTGPSEAAWAPGTEQGKIWASALSPNGALGTIKNEICVLSRRLRIFLDMCGQLPYSPILPTKHKLASSTYENNANPFGITHPLD